MASLGRWRFLKDHFVGGEYIEASEIREMFDPWVPTADVEPLDQVSLAAFYAQGPKLGGVWRTVRDQMTVYKPLTYWYAVAVNLWGLTGLGGGTPGQGGEFSADFNNDFNIGVGAIPPLSPIAAQLTRIEDKEV